MPCPAPTEMTDLLGSSRGAVIGLGHTLGWLVGRRLRGAVAFDLVLPPAARLLGRPALRCRGLWGWRCRGRLPAQAGLASHLGTLRRIARRGHRVVGSQAEAFTVFVRTQLVAYGEMAFEHLLLLAAHQADEVIPAERSAYRNCGLWRCGCGLRSITDLRQTASHQSDDDFELGGRHSIGRDVRGNDLRSQFENLPRSRGSLIACSSRRSRRRF